MRILVTGANGQLGNEIRIIAQEHPEWDFIFTDISEHPDGLPTEFLDITVPISIEGELDAVVNCAAYTNVDAAEDNEELAYKLNCTAAANLALLSREKKATLIHISTDYVFNGKGSKPCLESDIPCPVSAYGRTKLAGEQAVTASGCRYVIIRTAWLYSEFGKNFMKTMLKLTSERLEVKVVNDQTGTPTYALDLAKVIFKMLETGINESNQGIYHYSNDGICTWYDFAKAISELGGHPGTVFPCSSEEFPSKVERPAYSVLDKGKIRTVFAAEVPAWEDSLRKCFESYSSKR